MNRTPKGIGYSSFPQGAHCRNAVIEMQINIFIKIQRSHSSKEGMQLGLLSWVKNLSFIYKRKMQDIF